jgi:hypothetical protein
VPGEQRITRHSRGRVDDGSSGPDDLREAIVGPAQAPRLAQALVGLLDERGHGRGARPQAAVDRVVEVRLKPQVEKESGCRQQERHRDRERGGQPDPNRQAAQRPSSFRSR